MPIPHPALLVLGLLVGLTAVGVAAALPPTARAWPMAAAPAAGLLVGPGLGAAVDSWSRPGALAAAVVAIGIGFAATGGAAAAEPLGPLGTWWALAATAGATVLGVPDTEGPVVATGALAAGAAGLTWARRRQPSSWPVPEPAAALAAAVVAVVAAAGATDGIPAAVGVLGAAAVPLAAGPLGRRTPRPAVPAWASVPILGSAAVAVARLGAVRSTSARALAVTVVAIGAAWAALEVAARVTSGPARPPR